MEISKNTERGYGKSALMAKVAAIMATGRDPSKSMFQAYFPRGYGLNYEMDKRLYREYEARKYKRFNELKGGNSIMETKSRYEVIAELEEKKRTLIINRDNLPGELQEKQRELKMLKREVEDKEEENKEFEEAIESQKATINELIKSTDDSLNRFAELGKKKS